jgi:hypothetical protein
MDPRREPQRNSSSMEPRPESEGDGVPVLGVAHDVQDAPLCGNLESSLLTCNKAIVDAATRDAERVDTALHMLWNNIASGTVYVPFSSRCVEFNKSLIAAIWKPFLSQRQ